MKYKIIFDTNFVITYLQPLENVFSDSLHELRQFINKYHIARKVALLVPEIVLEERIQQRLQQIREKVNGIESSLENLHCFGVKKMAKKVKAIKYEKFLRLNATNFLKENKIQLIKISKVDNSLVVQRSLSKTNPFSSQGDKGFKDTMIWLSILDNVKHDLNLNNYILCSADNDMNFEDLEKEFSSHSNKKFFIAKDINELQQYLNDELVLKLELKELHRQISEELGELTGTITMKVNSELKFDEYNYQNSFAHETIAISSITDNLETKNFNFDDMKIISIFEESNKIFRIELELRLKKPQMQNYLGLSQNYGYKHEFERKTFMVVLRYFREKREIKVFSVSEMFQPFKYGSVFGKQ